MTEIRGFSETKFRDVRSIMRSESPRGKLILAAAFADEALQSLLEARLVEPPKASRLLEPSGPICTFADRIDLAHGLGCISDRVWKCLHRLRGIRNDCAHLSVHVDFSSPPIRDRILGLIELNREFFEQMWPGLKEDMRAEGIALPDFEEGQGAVEQMLSVMKPEHLFSYWISILVGFLSGTVGEMERLAFTPIY